MPASIEPEPRPLAILVAVAVVALSVILVKLNPGLPYPACGDAIAVGGLARLYDNRRLLHAIGVANPHLLNDGFKGRYCSATVTWQDGSRSDVPYEFYKTSSGKNGPTYIYMYIEYNGGENGPVYR